MREDSILLALKNDDYRLGNCQILLYNRNRPEIWGEGYLSKLYQACKLSGRRPGLGILPSLFCGMDDLSHDAITSYLHNRPVIIPGLWASPNLFMEKGLAFPSHWPYLIGKGSSEEKAGFFGYGFFKSVWGTPQAEILMMLGLAYFFCELDLVAIHGLRYTQNELTARFTRKFGFVENGTIPRYMSRDGKLVSAVSSTLFLETFEKYVEKKLLELWKSGELSDGREFEGWRHSSDQRAG